MTQAHVAPFREGRAFNCPHCRVFSRQRWNDLHAQDDSGRYLQVEGFRVVVCTSCLAVNIWHYDQMIYPDVGLGDPANPDLGAEIVADYEEARRIAEKSPRGAAALLRLCIQKLCTQLGKPGKNINSDIAALVADGLPTSVQLALDTVRVIGNEAVHPGTIDLRDDKDTVRSLFSLINFIASKMISEHREVAAIYSMLPANKRDEIAKRDKAKP